MPDDEPALRARLAALDAEVKVEADAARVRKEAALARLREQRAQREAERAAEREVLSRRTRRASSQPPPPEPVGRDAELAGTALTLARKADGVRAELAKPRKPGDKSWKTSALLSTAFGPIGWLYAGSFREAIPAAAAWLAACALIAKVFPFLTFLLLPVLAVVLPLSGLVGIVYASSYNKHGKRGRLFSGDSKSAKPKPLPPGSRD